MEREEECREADAEKRKKDVEQGQRDAEEENSDLEEGKKDSCRRLACVCSIYVVLIYPEKSSAKSAQGKKDIGKERQT